MTVRYVLGIDVGTTALKAVVLERERGIVAQAERPHELLSPYPGWAEEDPERWWTTTVETIRQLLTIVPADEIGAIGVSGMVPAMVMLDTSGKPIRPSIQQNDARTIIEVGELRADVDLGEFLTITGGTPNQQNIDTKWRWLKRHEPGVIERTAHLCGSYDFIVYRLTGQFSLEENWAAESGLYDVQHHHWYEPYLEHAGIDATILPPVRQPIHIVAGISTPHFYFDYHDIPGLTLINGCMAASGSLVKWFAHELGGGMSPAALDAEAEKIPPGAGGIIALPYFLGEKTPIFDPAARGVFAGLMLHHTRAHLYRAILESVCYGFEHHLTLLQEAGRPIRRVVAADGGSRSKLWMQIAADVVDQQVQVVAGEAASALGSAYVAAMGIGMFAEWQDITRFISQGPIYYPQKANVERYRTGFELYRDLYKRLRTFLPELGRLD